MTPYDRALEDLARAEGEYARLRSPLALGRVLRAKRAAEKVYRLSFGTDQNPTPGPTIGNRR